MVNIQRMKRYVLIGFVILAVVALVFVSRSQKERFDMKDTLAVEKIKNRLTSLETKIKDSDESRTESVGKINSVIS
jgi:FtsZ-interacting cell division protein ZipA